MRDAKSVTGPAERGGGGKAGHTEGPWEIVPFSRRNGEADGLAIRVRTRGVCEVAGYRGDPDCEANATLIRSAPELLAALEAVEARLTRVARAFYEGGKASDLREAFSGWRDDAEKAREALVASVAK